MNSLGQDAGHDALDAVKVGGSVPLAKQHEGGKLKCSHIHWTIEQVVTLPGEQGAVELKGSGGGGLRGVSVPVVVVGDSPRLATRGVRVEEERVEGGPLVVGGEEQDVGGRIRPEGPKYLVGEAQFLLRGGN